MIIEVYHDVFQAVTDESVTWHTYDNLRAISYKTVQISWVWVNLSLDPDW